MKREKEKEIKKLEEKELKPKRASKTKIVIISKDKKKNNYDNPSEIKMGRIYTTLNQNNKKVKTKAKSVQKGKINNINNKINEELFVNMNMFSGEQNMMNNNELENLLQKNMEFAGKVNEIKKFLKK